MEAYEKLIRWYLRWLRRGAAVLSVTAVCTFARRRAVFAGIAGLAAFVALVLWQETQLLRPVLITALAACVIYLWWALYEYRKTRFLD